MATVLVVDDEPQVRHALRRALEGEGDRVLSAATGTEAVDLAAAETPDLVVLDLWLPDIDGVEVVRRLRTWLDVPILILSGDSDTERKVDALDSGADDFLRQALRVPGADGPAAGPEAAHGPRPGGPSAVVRPAGRRPPPGAAELDGGLLRLTPTEWQLLEAMVTHPGKLLTHRWLLARVWGDQHGDESRQALRTHIRSLRSKIGDDAGTPSYLRTESGAGYRWLPEPQRSENGDGTQPDPAGPAAPQAAVGSRAVALHDINNVLTALHLSLHVAIDGTGRLAADGQHPDDVERIASQLRRSVRLVDRAGELAQSLRQVWHDGEPPLDE